MTSPSSTVQQSQQRYWRANLRIMAVLLSLWALVSLGCGILWADVLNRWNILGMPAGFWFAQQGSIITFVFIILIYALLLNRLDRKHRDELRALRSPLSPRSPRNKQAVGAKVHSATETPATQDMGGGI